ncbi:gliding motility lipoprotein GldH [Rapidithrix thailandica]|uniref:Gliding motility lipoprotein GldH n=1 Tax=Rapidithrix thailandica TaxID=413964 RepID=A0AAW9S5P7_9BACT
MKCIFSIVAITFCLWGCQPEGRIYVEHKELSPEAQWKQEDVRKFDVAVEDITQSYRLSLAFRHAKGYPYEELKVKVTETDPKGTQSVKEYALKIRDEYGNYAGEGEFGIWDSEHLIEAEKTYPEKGAYSYSIEHVMPDNPIPMALEIGLILDKASAK